MRLALLGPIAWRTPPVHYGPWELITSLLAEGLTARGVDVTLFATLDSVTKATLDGVVSRGYEEDPEIDGRVWEALHVGYALERSGEFDLVHNHLDWLPLAFSEHCKAPMLTTIHGFSGRNILPAYRAGRSAYVSISDADRSPDLDYVGTVYHGVDLDESALRPGRRRRPGVFGRIHPDKGTHAAIEIARRSGRRLTLCGIVQDEQYFERAGGAAHRRRRRGLSGLGGTPRPRADPRCERGPVASDPVRGAIRALRGRVHDLWYARCRVPRRVRCRRSSTRASPAGSSTESTQPWPPWRISTASTGPPAVHEPVVASALTAWSTTT